MEKSELIKIIDKAFENVTLGDGIGLYEAEALDYYANDKKLRKARNNDRKHWKKWSEIPDQVIEASSSALCFVDAEGMRFLLPAFIKFAIVNYKNSSSISIDSPIYALERGFSIFDGNVEFINEEQKNAIAKFLKFIEQEAGEDYVDAQFASNAYMKHWDRYDIHLGSE